MLRDSTQPTCVTPLIAAFIFGPGRATTQPREDFLMLTRITLATFAVAVLVHGQTIKTVPPTATSPVSGKQMFNEYCAVCHGQDGKGSGPAATALKKKPTDLTQLTAHNNGKFPDSRVARYIEGDDAMVSHGSRDMPIWGDVFKSMSTDKDVTAMRISNLTAYIKGLQDTK
jgi:mono/diheme cytochrome c family protein